MYFFLSLLFGIFSVLLAIVTLVMICAYFFDNADCVKEIRIVLPSSVILCLASIYMYDCGIKEEHTTFIGAQSKHRLIELSQQCSYSQDYLKDFFVQNKNITLTQNKELHVKLRELCYEQSVAEFTQTTQKSVSAF